MKKLLTLILIISGFVVDAKAPGLSAEQVATPPPKIIRTCCAFGANIGVAGVPFYKKTDLTSVSAMGAHSFLGGRDEKNGNIYTRRGGFIDLGHLRDCADWTAYMYDLIKASKTDSGLKIIKIGYEGGEKVLTLRVPENMDDEDTLELAGKIAYDLSVWHEISTWFGARYVPLFPERFSSFSPEDLYSNLLGVHLGMMAIKSDKEYDEAMTELLAEMLYNLECVDTEDETLEAMLKVDNLWYNSEKRFPSRKVLLKRYLDPESALLPWLVPGIRCELPPYVLQKPGAQLSGFYQLSIKLNYHFPVKEIFSDESDRIVTQNDFQVLIEFISQQLILEEEREQNKTDRTTKRKEDRKSESEFTSS